MKKFEIIDHTADVGIIAYGQDIKELFANAANGMFSIMTDTEKIKNQKSKIKNEKLKIKNVKIEAENREELLVRWLNELLFQSVTKGLLFSRFEIKSMSDNCVIADVYGRTIDSSENITTEVKAATYHQLKITSPRRGNAQAFWQAKIIFDI